MSAAGQGPRRGEIWWAYIPGHPADPHQPRPVLVVSVDARNRLTDDVIVVPIFSRGRLGPTRVVLPAGEGGIAHDSVVFAEEITTLDRGFLRDGPLGSTVSAVVLSNVIHAIIDAIVP